MSGNLWTPADGLLDTHVTWNDVQQAVQEAFGKDAVMGENKSLSRIGEGNGFCSNIAIVKPDWQSDSSKDLPTKFVVKLATCLNLLTLVDKIDEKAGISRDEEENALLIKEFAKLSCNLHNTEVYVYDLLKKYTQPHEVLPILTTHFRTKFSETNPLKGFIGFECVENVYLRHCYHNIKPSDLSEVLRTIARIQVIMLRISPEERKGLPNVVPEMYKKAVNKEKHDKILKSFSMMVREEFRPVIEEIKEFVDQLTDLSKTVTINEELGMSPVFVHGDLWSSNIMWKQTDNGIEFLKLIDFQIAHYGCAAEDFVRLFCSTLSGYDFINSWESLIEQFYAYFLEELKGEKAPYTLEQLKQSYERLLPQALLLFLLILQPIAEAGCKNNNDGEDSMEVLQEKIEAAFTCMLKSLKKYH